MEVDPLPAFYPPSHSCWRAVCFSVQGSVCAEPAWANRKSKDTPLFVLLVMQHQNMLKHCGWKYRGSASKALQRGRERRERKRGGGNTFFFCLMSGDEDGSPEIGATQYSSPPSKQHSIFKINSVLSFYITTITTTSRKYFVCTTDLLNHLFIKLESAGAVSSSRQQDSLLFDWQASSQPPCFTANVKVCCTSLSPKDYLALLPQFGKVQSCLLVTFWTLNYCHPANTHRLPDFRVRLVFDLDFNYVLDTWRR